MFVLLGRVRSYSREFDFARMRLQCNHIFATCFLDKVCTCYI